MSTEHDLRLLAGQIAGLGRHHGIETVARAALRGMLASADADVMNRATWALEALDGGGWPTTDGREPPEGAA